MNENNATKIQVTTEWIERFIIGLDICPFAKHIPKAEIKYQIEEATGLLPILENIATLWHHMKSDTSIETTFLIYANASNDFLTFLDDYYACEQLLEDMEMEEDFQLVAFHPHFIFDENNPDDPANYTNRSPYPMIHILRTDSVTKAIEGHPDVESIPEINMQKLREKESSHWRKFIS